MDHFRNACPNLNKGPKNNNTRNHARHTNRGDPGGHAHGRAFAIKQKEACQDPKVVTGTFLLNNHYASILFDSGEDRSFVSHEFRPLIDLKSKIGR